MHYSRILASVALVAVSYGAPVADNSSTKSSASSSSTSSSSSSSATVTPSAIATKSLGSHPIFSVVALPGNSKPHSSSSSSASYPSVTPASQSGYFAPPAATFVPVPAGYGVADSKASTYDFATDDAPLAIAEPPFETDFDAPETVEAAGEDTAFEAVPEQEAVDIAEAYPVDKAVSNDVDTTSDTAFDTASDSATDAVPEETTADSDGGYASDNAIDTVEEPKAQQKNARAIGSGPALKKHCR